MTNGKAPIANIKLYQITNLVFFAAFTMQTIVILLFLVALPFAHSEASGSQGATLRVAMVGFTRSESSNSSRLIQAAFADSIRRDPRVALVDQSMVQSALAGIGYDGSINLSKTEARNLAAAIGCDFFITGKSDAFTRSERAHETHEEAYAGVMIVDGRSGALKIFDLISEKASTRDKAQQSLVDALNSRITGYVERMSQLRDTASNQRTDSTATDRIEEMPDDGSSREIGFKPPEFLNRVKPEYTVPAELADITASVEAMVIFSSTGEIGGIEITRWAGFGLDESSGRAIRQLKFKPATRDGKPISVRAVIQHNFRRVPATLKLER